MIWVLLIFLQHPGGIVSAHTEFSSADQCQAAKTYALHEMPLPAGTLAISAVCVASGGAA